MSVESFIPEIWSAALLTALESDLVYASDSVVNRDYEGEIKNQGDTVQINQITDITVSDYVELTDIDNEALTTTAQQLLIDQAKYFSFTVDDIEKVQTAGNSLVSSATSNAGYQMANEVDVYLANLMAPAGEADIADTVISSAEEATDLLIAIKVLLDEGAVPQNGRFCIVSPWFHGFLLGSPTFISSGAAAADVRAVNGRVGTAYGMDILLSNNVPVDTGVDSKITAGVPEATSFAMQLTEVEAIRSTSYFGDIVRGLNVYGGLVTRDGAVVVADASKS